MIGFTTLEIISLKSHRTPKMFDDDDDDDDDDDQMMMTIIIIITENMFLTSSGHSICQLAEGLVFSN